MSSNIERQPQPQSNEPKNWLCKRWKIAIHKDNRDFALEVVKTIGIAVTGVGLLFTIWEGLENRRLDRERLITERFSKAVIQLKEESPTVRIGGIYALERIAKDSKKDYWTIMDILTFYVRENFSYLEQETESAESDPSIDLQAVINVIGRRDDPPQNILQRILNLFSSEEPESEDVIEDSEDTKNQKREYKGPPYFIDLSATNLQKANFYNANLKEANFYNANLKEANLKEADLREAKLFHADLKEANLEKADLRGADLFHADLKEANLEKADLEGGELLNADLTGADLKGANLKNANLSNSYSDRELAPQQIISACFWDRALYKIEWDSTKKVYVPKPDNQKYIQELKEDLKNYNDEKDESVDCSRWE